MKTMPRFLQITVSMLILAASLVTSSCKNSNTTNSTTSADTTAMPAAAPKMSDSSARKNDTMSKMKMASPAPLKWKATTKEEAKSRTAKISEDKNHIYNYSEVMPVFPGGDSALINYLQNNIKYPGAALDNQKEGTVNVHFVIDENGKVMNPQVQGQPLGYGLDDEAVRVVSSMPDWTPGTNKGKKVKVSYILPITFMLSK